MIEAGGIQWMTAGSDLIHSEISFPEFKKSGGNLEMLQLWVNLPAKDKMVAPRHLGLQQTDIPAVVPPAGRVTVHAVSGEWLGTAGAVQPLTDMSLATTDFQAGGQLQLAMPTDHTVFFYAIRGRLRVNGQQTEARKLPEFHYDGTELQIEALTDAVLLLGHAAPFQEPNIAYDPFVMNTAAEIRQAYQAHEAGRFGTWQG
ncbi:hypothetical protein GCM10022406_23790 [Hymenobacter algoricola]|uniref:Pirin C-terminal domain-containing protein n=1 Tax=Hymenobacter algoricola TaxID=486267 RepID=A0ABP7N9E0_9BACT